MARKMKNWTAEKHVLSKNYEGVVLTLVDEKTLKPATMGQEVETFRGESFRIVGGQAPRHSASTGRVHVETLEGWASEFFPGVVGMKWL